MTRIELGNRIHRGVVAAVAAVALWPLELPAEPGGPAEGWGEAETRLANQYLRLLAENPEYGAVVGLLWDLYRSHGATDLLLEHFAGQRPEPGATLVHGHLLRKAGRLDEAADAYRAALEAGPGNPEALGAIADLAADRGDYAEALDALSELGETLPDSGSGAGAAAHHLRVAELQLMAGDRSGASESLDAAAAADPDNADTRVRVARARVRAGDLPGAASVFRAIADRADPTTKAAALEELATVYELDNRTGEAAAVYREGMALTHFQHHLHQSFFRRLVRLHERSGDLAGLETELEDSAGGPQPSEEALLACARFAELTVQPKLAIRWLRALHQTFPDRGVYLAQLTGALADDDQYEAAAELLATVLDANGTSPAAAAIRLAGVEARAGQRDAAARRLSGVFARIRGDAKTTAAVLAAATEHSLDTVAEEVLQARAEANPGAREPALELARFYLARNRDDEAIAALRRYIGAGDPVDEVRADRLGEASDTLAAAERFGEASDFAEEAVASGAGGADGLVRIAESRFALRDLDGAIEALDQAWELAGSSDARTAIDQKVFSFLQYRFLEARQEAEQRQQRIGTFFPTLAAVEQASGGAPGDGPADRHAEETVAFASSISGAARATPTPDRLRRAAWWAFRTDDFPAAFDHLVELRRLEPEPDLPTAQLTLEVAKAAQLYGLAKRSLDQLRRLDPDNDTNYLVELALLEMAPPPIGPDYPERAIALLEPVVEGGALDHELAETLANAYRAAGRPDEALQLWRDAFDRARDTADRALALGPLTGELVARGREEEAAMAYGRVVREEPDPGRRRELFEQQLALAGEPGTPRSTPLLEKLAGFYREAAAEDPLEPFWNEALGRVLRVAGKLEEATGAFRRAYYARGSAPAPLLVQLRDTARELGDDEAALYFQRQVIFSAGGESEPAEWKVLVEMLERTLDIDATDRVRLRLERKFSGDAAVLEELSDYYERTGQTAAALRTAGRLAALRPWDARAALRLGLLYRETGRPAEALEAFRAALEHTSAADAGDSPLFELREPGFLASAILSGPLLPLRESGRLRDTIEAAGNHSPRLPADAPAIRLRAAALGGEAATKVGEPDLKTWRQRWRRETATEPVVAFRALYTAGDFEAAAPVAEELLLGTESEASYFRFAYIALRMGVADRLARWLRQPGVSPVYLAKRQRFCLATADAMLRTDPAGGGDPGFPPLASTVAELARRGAITPAAAWTLAMTAGSVGEPARALEITAAMSPPPSDPQSQFAIARWSAGAGNEAGERDSLEACFDGAAPSPRQQAWLPDAFRHLYRESDDPAVRGPLERQAARIAGHFRPHSNNPMLDPATLLFGIATDADRPSASGRIGGAAAARSLPAPSEYWSPLRYWNDARSAAVVFDAYGLGPVAQACREQALGSLQSPPSADDDTGGLYPVLTGQSLAGKMGQLSHPERLRLARSTAALPLDDQERTIVASQVQAAGFPRAAAAIFHDLALAEPTNAERLRAFLDACAEALDPEPAVAHLSRILKVPGDIDPPERQSLSDLSTEFAKFLRMAGDAESLEAYSRKAPNAPDTPERQTSQELPYLRALADLQIGAGREAAAVPVLRDVLAVDPDDAQSKLDLARALSASGDHAGALKTLAGARGPDSLVPPTVAAQFAIEEARLLAETGDRGRLRALLRESNTPDFAIAVDRIAGHAASAGLASEAAGLLELARRDAKSAESRFRLAMAELEICLGPTTTTAATAPAAGATAGGGEPATPEARGPGGNPERDRLAATLTACLQLDRPSPADTARLIEILREHRDTLAGLTPRAVAAEDGTNPALAALVRLVVDGETPADLAGTPGANRAITDTAAGELLDRGEAGAALALVEAPLRGRTRDLTRSPKGFELAVAAAASLSDEPLLERLYHQARRADPLTPAKAIAPRAFADAGQHRRAAALYAQTWDGLRNGAAYHLGSAPATGSRTRFSLALAGFLGDYAAFLTGQGDPDGAIATAAWCAEFAPDAAAVAIGRSHARAGRAPDSLGHDLRRFHLSSGVVREAARQARLELERP